MPTRPLLHPDVRRCMYWNARTNAWLPKRAYDERIVALAHVNRNDKTAKVYACERHGFHIGHAHP